MQRFEDLRQMLLANYQQVMQPFATPAAADPPVVDADDPVQEESAPSPPHTSATHEQPPAEEANATPTPEDEQERPPTRDVCASDPSIPPVPPSEVLACEGLEESEASRLRPFPLEGEQVRMPHSVTSSSAPLPLTILARPPRFHRSAWPPHLNALRPCRWCGATSWMARQEDGRWMCSCYFSYGQVQAATATQV
jgi:hypothetical protein